MPKIEVWKEVAAEPTRFEECALEMFAFQAKECATYRRYIELIECNVEQVKSIEQIPFMPIELFKSCDVYSIAQPAEAIFTSSSTTGSIPSRHPMASLSHYEKVAANAFEREFGTLADLTIYALLPGYLEREGSSLIYMVERFIERSKGGGFFLRNHEELIHELTNNPDPKILLGVTYALLDLADRGALKLENTIIMETGGMKGTRAELPKSELHKILCSAFSVDYIASEYGMAELTSQAYSHAEGLFTSPPWMRVLIRDINDPFTLLPNGSRGGINIVDLASWHSCAFIQTQDIGRTEGESFRIEGRVNRSEIRGCNLLVNDKCQQKLGARG